MRLKEYYEHYLKNIKTIIKNEPGSESGYELLFSMIEYNIMQAKFAKKGTL